MQYVSLASEQTGNAAVMHKLIAATDNLGNRFGESEIHVEQPIKCQFYRLLTQKLNNTRKLVAGILASFRHVYVITSFLRGLYALYII